MDDPRPPEFAPLEDGTPPHPDAGYEHFDRLEHVRKPVIACIHGYAVGGDVEITLCADIRLATEDALLGTPEPRSNGGMPGIAVHRLAQLVPHGEAMRIMLTSQPITGRRAYDVGLVQELAADVDGLAAVADRYAAEIMECNPSSMTTIKQLARFPYLSKVAASQQFASFSGANPRGEEQHSEDLHRGADYLASRRAARDTDDA